MGVQDRYCKLERVAMAKQKIGASEKIRGLTESGRGRAIRFGK